MKCLSLWQPWATLIAIGAKSIETRSWYTAYRGPLLIHAAKYWSKKETEICCSNPYAEALQHAPLVQSRGYRHGLPRGCIVAVAELADCQQIGCALWFYNDHGLAIKPLPKGAELSFGDYTPGRFGWFLKNVRCFPTPIPCVGHQGLFNVPDSLVAEQIAAATLATCGPYDGLTDAQLRALASGSDLGQTAAIATGSMLPEHRVTPAQATSELARRAAHPQVPA